MIQDCLDIFAGKLDDQDRLILDHYVPKDGTYLLIEMDEGMFRCRSQLDIRFNKKTGTLEGSNESEYEFVKLLDYNCKLVEMNKPIDPKKVIHSNNYLSFFVKKESLVTEKMTSEILDGYYEVLKSPITKYEKKPKSREIYEVLEQEIGGPDIEMIEQIKNWVTDHLNTLEVDLSKKDYLKLFFVLPDREKTLTLYQNEGKRYLIPNIYNSNDSNIVMNGELYGLPNDNMGMNSKKPYLEHKTRKVREPYLLDRGQAMLQSKFFDYLMGNASVGKTNVYIDPVERTIKFYRNGEFAKDFQTGYYLRIQKGKEVEVHNFDTITQYQFEFDEPFRFKQIIEVPAKVLEKFEVGYGLKTTLSDIQFMIDDVFFGKWLVNNYFTDVGDLSMKDGTLKFNLITARERLFSWFYKGNTTGIAELLDQVSLSLVKNSIVVGNYLKAKHQMNLRWSFIDYFSKTRDKENAMGQVRDTLRQHINQKEDWDFENDNEYYYAVGQLIDYYISKNKGKKVPQSFVNPFLNAKTDEIIKKRLVFLYKRVNYSINTNDFRVSNLISHIMQYSPNSNVDQDFLIGGFTDKSLIYEAKKEDE